MEILNISIYGITLDHLIIKLIIYIFNICSICYDLLLVKLSNTKNLFLVNLYFILREYYCLCKQNNYLKNLTFQTTIFLSSVMKNKNA